MYNCIVNKTTSGNDTRLIINRGLVESGTHTGLRFWNKDDTFFLDTINNRSMVYKLIAA